MIAISGTDVEKYVTGNGDILIDKWMGQAIDIVNSLTCNGITWFENGDAHGIVQNDGATIILQSKISNVDDIVTIDNKPYILVLVGGVTEDGKTYTDTIHVSGGGMRPGDDIHFQRAVGFDVNCPKTIKAMICSLIGYLDSKATGQNLVTGKTTEDVHVTGQVKDVSPEDWLQDLFGATLKKWSNCEDPLLIGTLSMPRPITRETYLANHQDYFGDDMSYGTVR